MGRSGLFTESDLVTISRASALAEKLTGEHFSLSSDEWRRNPYAVLTRKHVGESIYEDEVFAHVVRYQGPSPGRLPRSERDFAIVLQDPTILRALLRSALHDLWTLALFILTHELTHIVRFRRFGVDFFGTDEEREMEESIVHELTRNILKGVSNTEGLLELYEPFSEICQSDISIVPRRSEDADL